MQRLKAYAFVAAFVCMLFVAVLSQVYAQAAAALDGIA
jgi:hypothetical protein